jgi:NAD(P)-dependent dehydrogenase (short-subunit alcohol dehydrogenase family)
MKKTALVTGGARGIGFGISQKLAKENFDLIICGTRPEESVKDAVESLKQMGADVLYCQCNIADANDRQKMLKTIKTEKGSLNLLVNNAGVAPNVRADILEATEESYERVMKINLQGPYFLTQAVANWMIELKQVDESFECSIVNVSSISASTASPSRGEYCISKAGISMATQLWAVRLGEFNIPVYEIRPGIIKTDMTSAVTAKYDKLIHEDGLLVQDRWGYPEDIGKAVAMLARGDLPYSTGQVLMIDGGFSLERL